MLNKKGDEQLLSIWMFLIWIIVAGAIVTGVWMFFSVSTDVRDYQANLLVSRVVDCVGENGIFNSDFLKEDFDFFEECRIDDKWFKENNFLIKIEIFDEDLKELKKIIYGNPDFETQCELVEDAGAKYFAKCSDSELVLLRDNQKVIVKILGSSNNLEGLK
jgi:hypothetical protein